MIRNHLRININELEIDKTYQAMVISMRISYLHDADALYIRFEETNIANTDENSG